MKRRFISMALCLLMLTTAFASVSCGEEEVPNAATDDTAASRAMTLTIWGVKGDNTTDEAIAAVEAAMSSITESKFNTAIKLNLFEEDEYDKALEARMDEIQAQLDKEAEEAAAKKAAEKEAKKNKETTAETTAAEEETSDTADETILDEYGLPATLFPEVEDTQLDIFLMTDYDMLNKYSEKGVLSNLDEQLNSSSKLIKSYIHPTLLSAGKVNGTTVAILNNHPIGEYTYMLLNKELLDEFYYDVDNISSLPDALNFMMDVGREKSDYTPFMGDSTPLGINYYTLDGTPLITGSMLVPRAVSGDQGTPKLLFSVGLWSNHITTMVNLNEHDYIGSETINVGDKFGVGVIKGNAADVEPFAEDYHVKVLQVPQGTTDNIFTGMFAVSKYTKNLARSMEIVTYLNTNAEFVNTFTYGVRDVHYSIDRNDNLTVLSDDYNMNPAHTGNMFIAHAPEGEGPDYWEAFKQQNLEAVLSPYYGFEYTEDMIDTALLAKVVEYSNNFYDALEDQTGETIAEFLTTWWEDAKVNEDVQNWIKSDLEENPNTIGKVYADWYNTAHPVTG